MAFLEMRGVDKRYGGVVALDDASLSAERGEVHGLLGANGSGKSSLNKILTGVVAPDRATIEVDGVATRIHRPQDAHHSGIAAVYQELSLIPDLSVAANIVLAFESTRLGFVQRRRDRDRAEALLERFAPAFHGGILPIQAPVGSLSPGEQQIVEIAKAIAREPDILVLDEATASLYSAQVEVVSAVVRELRAAGTLVVFTSHRLGEVYDLCDRATVLRNGAVAGSVALAETSEAELVELMVGSLGAPRRRPAAEREEAKKVQGVSGVPRLEVVDLSTDRLEQVSCRVAQGEVLGLGGLAGQGQSEFLNALFGAVRIRHGSVEVDGQAALTHRPKQAVDAGIALVPGDRNRQGLFPVRPILENLTVPSMRRRARLGVLSDAAERAAASRAGDQLQIKFGALDDGVMTLSGGNQQKVVVGKWLLTDPRVVLLDDPTKGIDVRAKAELYEVIGQLTERGVAVLLNSSDDDELLTLSHRVLVFFEGRIVSVLAGDDLTRERLVADSLQVTT